MLEPGRAVEIGTEQIGHVVGGCDLAPDAGGDQAPPRLRDRQTAYRLANLARAIVRGGPPGGRAGHAVAGRRGVKDLCASGREFHGRLLAETPGPDQAGELAVPEPDRGGGAEAEQVEPAQRGKRPERAAGGAGFGNQQRHPAVDAVAGEDSRSHHYLPVGQAGQQSRGLGGQPGQLVLPRGDERHPHRTLARGVAGQLAGEVAQLRVGQPRRHVGDPGYERVHGTAVWGVQQVGVRPRGAAADRRCDGCCSDSGRSGRGLGGCRPDHGPGGGEGGRRARRGLRGDARPALVTPAGWLAAEHHVDVDAGTHATDAGNPRPVRPGLRRARQPQGGVPAAQQRMRPADAGSRRDDAGAHREHGLDQACGAPRRLRVPDVGLDRAEGGDASRAGAQLGKRGQLRSVARRCTRAVPLDQLDVGRRDPGSLVRPVQRQELAVGVGHGHVGLGRGRRAPAGDLGVHRQAGQAGVGRSHQHDHAAAFPGQEPGGARVVDAHVAPGQGAGLGQPDQLERVEAEVHAAGQGDVEIARRQRGARGRHREQRRRVRPVHGVAAAAEPEVAADPGRDGRGRAAGQGLVGGRGERRQVPLRRVPQHRHRTLPGNVAGRQRLGQHAPDVGPAQPQRGGTRGVTGQGVADDDPRTAPGQALALGESGRGERARRGLQRQPVRGVGRLVDAGRHAERCQVELPALEQSRPGAIGRIGRGPVGAVVVGQLEPGRRQPAECPAPGQHQVEKRGRVIGVGKAASHADDRDRLRAGRGVRSRERVLAALPRALTPRVAIGCH